ncbi:MAG: nucleotidyl transferase AbiEii/AbiGii toxin family protein, partial [Pseudomonadales bacterium]
IAEVVRDRVFDDDKMRSAGIRLVYMPRTSALAGVKDGILLELGFDDTGPNRTVTISSWALDAAMERGVKVGDNRAVDVPCYAPTHTFVEKLQTISTKYRRLDATEALPANFLRHYYDVYCLLGLEEVQSVLRTAAYRSARFSDSALGMKWPSCATLLLCWLMLRSASALHGSTARPRHCTTRDSLTSRCCWPASMSTWMSCDGPWATPVK